MTTETDGLDPIEPDDALRLYLDHKETEYSKNTVQSHRYRLESFVEWCEEIDLSNLNELTGRHLQENRLWRKENGDLVQISLNKQMYTVRAFIKWCGYIEAVSQELFEKLQVPRVSPEQQRRDDMLPTETAREHHPLPDGGRSRRGRWGPNGREPEGAEEHYDQRTEAVKLEQRRGYSDSV